MLTALSIRDVSPIASLDVEFSSGFTALTGESGAGKTLLLDALGFALGSRWRRVGSCGEVSATFSVRSSHPSAVLCAERGFFDGEDSELIFRRISRSDGRISGFVNDRSASASFMREAGRFLVEIHGQHESRALSDESSHVGILDGFGVPSSLISATRDAWRVRRSALEALRSRDDDVESSRLELERLDSEIDELASLSASSGEETLLSSRRREAASAERSASLSDEIGVALDAIDSGSFPSLLSRVERRVEEDGLSSDSPLGRAVASGRRLLLELEEARSAFSSSRGESVMSVEALDALQERLFALRAAGRKHRCSPDRLDEALSSLRSRRESLSASVRRRDDLSASASRAEAEYFRAATALSASRRSAAERLEASVSEELPSLKLADARFGVSVTPSREGSSGSDRVRFTLRSFSAKDASDEDPPLASAASGGETSRVTLAVRVASLPEEGSSSSLPTMVFDEVDVGVGGAIASAIGARLRRLGERTQTLAVTHSPQVAARADRHARLSKTKDGMRCELLEESHRREEIARMISGSRITSEARAQAAKLRAEGRA